MIIDFIDINKLPWVVVWMDWNFYAYKPSLLASIVFWTSHWHWTTFNHTPSGFVLSLFIGFCFWNVYCAASYGYAVG